MDIEEFKKFARNKIEADALTQQVRDVIKTTKWQKQDMREGFKETFKPLIKSQDSIKKSIDDQQNATIAQLKANQLALTQGLNQNRMAITEGFDKLDEVKKWDLAQLPGFEAIEEPKDKDPSTSEGNIAQFTPEDLNKNLMNKESQDILKSLGYDNLPSVYFEEDIDSINVILDVAKSDMEEIGRNLRNTALISPDANGYLVAKPINENPQKKTQDYIKQYNVLSIFSTNLNTLKLYKTKSGGGIYYFNPHQLLDRLELLGGSILAGNNGVIPEFSQIAHLLNQMKVISNKQLNNLLQSYVGFK